MTPLVSVIIDTYNHERFIEDAIRSVLDQDFPRSQMEILVVDDGSTDRTPEIIRKFEPQVTLLRKPNGGQASAFNHGCVHARGELVAFLDGDDVWLPNKLARVVAEFERCPDAVLVYHQFSYWDSRDGSVWLPEDFHAVSGDVLADSGKLLAYSAAPTSSLVLRRNALKRMMPIPHELVFMADAFIVATAIFLGPVAAIPESLAKYRVHGENLYSPDKHELDAKTLQRRIELRSAAIESICNWARSNVPSSQLPQARLQLRRMRLVRDGDEFRLKPPNRFRQFVHLCRYALAMGAVSPTETTAFYWAKAIAVLTIGRHAHYLEGVHTRIMSRLRSRPRSPGPERGGTGGIAR